MKNNYFLFLCFTLFISCTSLEGMNLKKENDNGLPKTSRWIGGKDGGEWVNITIESERFLFIDAYNEFTYNFKKRYSYSIVCDGLNLDLIWRSFKFTNGDQVFWKDDCRVINCLLEIE